MNEWLYDAAAFIGVATVCAGLWLQFGIGYALLFFGLVLIITGILGHLNDNSKQNTEQKDNGT